MSNAEKRKIDAVQQFINREFDAVPKSMVLAYIEKNGIDALEDITEFTVGENVDTDDGRTGEIVAIKGFEDEKNIDVRVYEDDKETIVNYPADEVYHKGWQGDNGMPMWNTMWILHRDSWIDHTQELSDSGFAVFDCYNEDKLVIGIDGCGYSFMDEHFVPLYDRMGLDWHKQVDREIADLANKAIQMAAEFGLNPEEIAKKLDLPKDMIVERMPKQVVK